MRTQKHTDGHTVIVTGPVKNDLKNMLQDVKKLDAQIKRLREAVNAYRISTVDQFTW
jgi:hypothetical protein